jgi:hypothetical protein
MWQSGHGIEDAPTWEMIEKDYQRIPRKPVLDGEPNYEDHPIDPWTRKWTPEMGRFDDHAVRKQGYRSVFAGACGYTYGHHTIWQFFDKTREPVNYPAFDWRESICRPGAAQLIHLKNLMLSRPYLERIPDQGFLISNPGGGAGHVQATRDQAGSYAMVYLPLAGQSVTVDAARLAGPLRVSWYDPRTGRSYAAGSCENQGAITFTAPIGGPDWVLVLDEEARKYPPPGRI